MRTCARSRLTRTTSARSRSAKSTSPSRTFSALLLSGWACWYARLPCLHTPLLLPLQRSPPYRISHPPPSADAPRRSHQLLRLFFKVALFAADLDWVEAHEELTMVRACACANPLHSPLSICSLTARPCRTRTAVRDVVGPSTTVWVATQGCVFSQPWVQRSNGHATSISDCRPQTWNATHLRLTAHPEPGS